MYSVIVFIGSDSYAEAVLLPLEQGYVFQVEQWLQCLEHKQALLVSSAPIALAVGDWIIRQLRQAKLMRKVNAQLKHQQRYISSLLTAIEADKPLQWQHYTPQAASAPQSVVGEHGRAYEYSRRMEQQLRKQVLEWLQGRKLLYDEWLGLIKDRQKVNAPNSSMAIDVQAAPTKARHEAGGETDNIIDAWRWLLLQGYIQIRSAVEWVELSPRKTKLRCLRCHETELVQAERTCKYCGERCYYCSSCLQMGRARTCSALLIGHYYSPLRQLSANDKTEPQHILKIESFGLSDAQHMATTQVLNFVYKRVGLQLAQSLSTKGDGFKEGGASLSLRRSAKFLNKVLTLQNKAPLQSTEASIGNKKAAVLKQRARKLQLKGKSSQSELASQFLLWAVTGAGKTEMIFPLVAYMIALGGRVLLATPRRDVVLELSPRLKKAFPELSIVTLYGGSEERWQHGQLVLATTHQLMRFQHAFDLVIIDELDAFPYHGDERLYRVAAQARTLQGVTILLSATPPSYLQQRLTKGHLAHVKLPVRYHRHPLPVPVRLKAPLITEQLHQWSIPPKLLHAITQSLDEDAQIFMFLQRIAHTEPYAKLLRGLFPHVNIQATSSQDSERSGKVMAFRQRDIRILVTTTILERGVTVPRSHVYICDAEDKLFDEASLVQMAGRAGRSGDAPNGAVYFLSQQWSSAQKQAIKQIEDMNKLALQQGYLLPQYRSNAGRIGG